MTGQTQVLARPHELHAADSPAAAPASTSLVFLDSKTGQSKELLKLDHQSLGAPLLIDHTLYVASSGKTLFALDPGTGNKKWEYQSERFLFGITATQKTVFVGAGGSLLALDPASGKLLWSVESDIPITDPVLADDLIVFNTFDGPVGLEQSTGKRRWQLDLRWSYFVFSPLSDGRLCVWKPDEIFVIDIASGKTLWENAADQTTAAPGALPSPAVGSADIICQLRGSKTDARDWSLHALDAPGGHLQWKTSLGDHHGTGARTLLAAETVYCVFDDTVTSLDRGTGKIRWQEKIKPLEAGGAGMLADTSTLYLPALGGDVVALDAKTGRQLWINPATPAEKMKIRFGGVCRSETGIYVARNELRNEN